MDNPKAKVSKTKIYGKDLFAKEDIKKGEIIADWTSGKVYTAKKATDLPNNPPDYVQNHAIQFAKNKWIDYKGIGRYFAHSCSPNCGFKGKFKIVAMRDIRKGEELTFDYEMSEDSDWKMKCICGNKDCRKIIGSFKNMPKNVREKYKGYISSWLKPKQQSLKIKFS